MDGSNLAAGGGRSSVGLILARSKDETVLLQVEHPEGGYTEIWVTVVKTNAQSVKIGFHAPGNVQITRGEFL